MHEEMVSRYHTHTYLMHLRNSPSSVVVDHTVDSSIQGRVLSWLGWEGHTARGPHRQEGGGHLNEQQSGHSPFCLFWLRGGGVAAHSSGSGGLCSRPGVDAQRKQLTAQTGNAPGEFRVRSRKRV